MCPPFSFVNRFGNFFISILEEGCRKASVLFARISHLRYKTIEFFDSNTNRYKYAIDSFITKIAFGCEIQRTNASANSGYLARDSDRGEEAGKEEREEGFLWGASRYGQDYHARTWGSLPLTDALRTTITH